MKMHGAITLGQAAKLCEELEARQPFSANKAVVKDARDFAGQLLAYMVKTGQVEKRGAEYISQKKSMAAAIKNDWDNMRVVRKAERTDGLFCGMRIKI